jgi:hypothetical protein
MIDKIKADQKVLVGDLRRAVIKNNNAFVLVGVDFICVTFSLACF